LSRFFCASFVDLLLVAVRKILVLPVAVAHLGSPSACDNAEAPERLRPRAVVATMALNAQQAFDRADKGQRPQRDRLEAGPRPAQGTAPAIPAQILRSRGGPRHSGPAGGRARRAPSEQHGEIVGRIDDGEGVEALVVSLGGTTDRPDGSTYHITWSLSPGRRAKESNDVIAKLGWTPIELPMPVRLVPARF
jgi:hypothetical protein